ncbi:unnamed protein product, partial [Prorocentrum cordatum]
PAAPPRALPRWRGGCRASWWRAPARPAALRARPRPARRTRRTRRARAACGPPWRRWRTGSLRGMPRWTAHCGPWRPVPPWRRRRATASSGRATTARRTPPTSAAPTRSRASASPHWPGSRAGCWRRCAATRRRRCSAPAWTAPPARVPGGWRTDAGPGAHERQGALLGPGPRQRETGRWRWRTSASSSGWSPTARRRRGRLGGPGRCCAGGGPAGAPSRREALVWGAGRALADVARAPAHGWAVASPWPVR